MEVKPVGEIWYSNVNMLKAFSELIVQCAFVISLNEYFTIVLSLVLLVLFSFNPLHLNITMCILHIILYTFPKVLTRVNE